MEALAYLAPFIPFLAMLPPALAAMWIANRWLKSRKSRSGLDAELGALRDEVALRQAQAELQERLDFTERMLGQVRDARRDLPRASADT